jgi:hypothetical protein
MMALSEVITILSIIGGLVVFILLLSYVSGRKDRRMTAPASESEDRESSVTGSSAAEPSPPKSVENEEMETSAARQNVRGVAILFAVVFSLLGGAVSGATYDTDELSSVLAGALGGVVLAFFPILFVAVLLKFPVIVVSVTVYFLLTAKGELFTPFMVHAYTGVFLFAIVGLVMGAIVGAVRNARKKGKPSEKGSTE